MTIIEATKLVGTLVVITIVWQYLSSKRKKRMEEHPEAYKNSFIERVKNRIVASIFPIMVIIFASILIFINISVSMNGKPLRIEEIKQVTGTVIKAKKGGKGRDYIILKDNYGNENEYTLNLGNVLEDYKNALVGTDKVVTVWFRKESFLFEKFNVVKQIKVNNEFISINGVQVEIYNYEKELERYNSIIPNILLCFGFILFGWAWLWFLNRKELPIHRLNREKFYKKYNLK